MKILIYSANFAPELTGIGKYSGEMAEWLVARGHSVRVVAAPPYYPEWKIHAPYSGKAYTREQWRGVDVWRTPIWVPPRPGGLARVLHLFSFALSSMPVVLLHALWRPNVVLTVAPALACTPAGWLTARLAGAKAWLHIQDFEVDVAFRMGLLRGAWTRRFVLWLEQRLLRRFDRVSSISGKMIDRLRQKGVDEKRTRFFPNWVDTSAVRPLDHPSAYLATLGIPQDSTVCLFSGTWGNKQGLMVIPAAARLLRHAVDIHFVICGHGVMRQQIEAACKDLPNVHLIPLQPQESLNELLGLASIHLLPQSPEAEDLVLPSKLTGMLSSGRPVIATCRENTEIGSVVRQCGLVVPPEDASALACAITRLHNDPALRRELGAIGRKYSDDRLAKESILSELEGDLLRADGSSIAAKSTPNV